jgi:3-oxoacyl-[acyl-carrier protein] reductase
MAGGSEESGETARTAGAEDRESSRVAIVTGGERGIGWAIASRLAAEGWHAVAAGLSPDRTAGSDVEFRALDVRDRDQVREVIEAVALEYGRLDLLVNNAGIQRHARTEEMTWEDWTGVIDVNLHGVFNCLPVAGRIMLTAGRGSIVNIASVAAVRGAPGRGPYCAAKAGVVSLTQTTAVEWAARGVRVNAVGPGFIDSGGLIDPATHKRFDQDEIRSRIPMGHSGEPGDIAGMVSFLASPDAGYITGQVFYVDGGFLVDFGIGLTGITR